MSSKTDRLQKVFPVTALLDFERQLLLKALDGWMMTKTEKQQLEKLLARLRGQG